MKRRIVALLGILLLIGSTVNAQIKVACIGNSITVAGYPQILDSILGENWEVKNFGVSGTTMLRNGDYPYYKTPTYTKAQGFNPDVVIIKLGTNDSKPQNWKYKNEYVGDYNKMISELKALPSHPFIIVCYPVKAYSKGWNINDSIIRNNIIPMVDEVAKENHLKVIDLYKPLKGHSEWFPDGIHPNKEGSEVIAKVIADKLTEWKKKLEKHYDQAYKDPGQPVENRVADLLRRMTLEEKVAQLISTHASRPKLTDEFFTSPTSSTSRGAVGATPSRGGQGSLTRVDSMYGNGVGMINPAFDETMEQTIERRNKLQNYLRTKTRLGIPVIFIDEAHHGLVQKNVDVFPHGIGLACSWDTALLTKIYDYIARQASSRGTNLVLAPVVDVTRDPRWGRTGETYGEDPFLNGLLGSAVVKGFQGSTNGIIAPYHVAATLKHFTGHGQPESGNNTGPANYSVRALREFHMEPFRLVIENAKPAAIMASYNEVDEIPSHANKWLLTDVLRKEWKYKGIVVSDWFGIDQLMQKHQFASDLKDATLKAFNAGVQVDLPYGINYVKLVELVKEGKINMTEIDAAVAYILRLKFQMGLFERKDIDVSEALNFNKKTEGRELALKIAEESMILLKNGLTPSPSPSREGSKPLLPIGRNQYKKIAVIGPCAAVNYLGDYSGVSAKNVSILEGIKEKILRYAQNDKDGRDDKSNKVEVVYAQGCKLTTNGDTISQNNFQFIDAIKFASKEENQKLINEAVEVAKQSDFVVLAVGENEQFSREAWNGHPGDMVDLNLQSQQEDLVKAIAATGKPYVVYLMHGRPLTINWIAENAPAIVDGHYSGEETGTAFANILFGDVNPSGKETMTWPRSVGQLPIYYNHQPTSHYYEYVTEKNTPLYSFGYGLSYTTFEYGTPRLTSPVQPKAERPLQRGITSPVRQLADTPSRGGYGGITTVSVDVTNTGKMKGDETVQLYIHQKSGNSVVRPVKELKGFLRISLNPGEKKTVSFSITDEMLKHWDADMKYRAESGVYEIMIGRSSADLQKIELTVK